MSLPPETSLSEYVYRRIIPNHLKDNLVTPDAFAISEMMKGLSVYRADRITPYDVIEARIEDARQKLTSDDEIVRQRAEKFLKNNPDVKSVLSCGYRIVAIPIASIKAMGMSDDAFEEPDEKGHMNLLGSVKLFDDLKSDFAELIKTNTAWILDIDDCLLNPSAQYLEVEQ